MCLISPFPIWSVLLPSRGESVLPVPARIFCLKSTLIGIAINSESEYMASTFLDLHDFYICDKIVSDDIDLAVVKVPIGIPLG